MVAHTLGIQRQADLSELRVGLDLHSASQVRQGYIASTLRKAGREEGRAD